MTTWSAWRAIDEPSGCQSPAVYKIRLTVQGRSVEVCRFLGKDGGGTLSIGHASKLERRRRQFVAAINVGRGHSEMNLLWRLQKQSMLIRIFPAARYEYCFRVVPSVEEAKAVERQLIKSYVLCFGEVPPLNSAIPGRYVGETWDSAVTESRRQWLTKPTVGALSTA